MRARLAQPFIERFRLFIGTLVLAIVPEGSFGEGPPSRPTAPFDALPEAPLFFEAFIGSHGAFFMLATQVSS